MPLIGTAGHVDHGKSTLVEALTGRNPDRWAEERRRGLTIDLGFAWTTLGRAGEVSFVDVPGHERFLKNMLAGIEAIDVALFVVAADEGWKPQSEEHLAVLDLLGIESGVIALSKIDTVDEDDAGIVEMEISERLTGTTLESAPIVPVSARNGEGIDRLRDELATRVSVIRHDGDRPRLWIDRAFSVQGAGTIVTGTLTEGPLGVGADVELLPSRRRARVRGMQSHETELDSAAPGRRLALNLSGIERSDGPRGTMVGLPGQWELSARFSARIRPARYVEDLSTRGAFQLHFGSGAHPATIKRLEGQHALFQLLEPLPMRSGDRFILRESGRRQVVAGGIVVDPAPGPPAAAMRTATVIDPLAGADAVATGLLRIRGIDDLERIAAHSGGGSPADAVVVGKTSLTRDRFDALQTKVEVMVAEDHDRHPLRGGIPVATVATTLGLFPELVERLIEESDLVDRAGPDISARGHRPVLDAGSEEQWAKAQAMLSESLAVPASGDLGLDRELTYRLIREGKLARVSDDLVFLPEQLEEITRLLSEMGSPFTVADFRDHTGLSRKYAVPLLEWADREGLTIRRGDLRHLR